MEVGMGVLGIPPSEFWQLSFKELFAATEGYRKANDTGQQKDKPLSRKEYEALKEDVADGRTRQTHDEG